MVNSQPFASFPIQQVSDNQLMTVEIVWPTTVEPRYNMYVDYKIKKANKRLYSLRVLKQCGAPPVSLAKVFVTIVRPILEYRAVPVWQNIAEFLASKIESIPERAMRIHISYARLQWGFICTFSHDVNWETATYVRSTLLDCRTKTTRYTLFFLNWRKFSIIIIWGQKLQWGTKVLTHIHKMAPFCIVDIENTSWKVRRTVFTHELLTYQKSYEWAQRTSEISDTKTTSA